MSKPEWKKYQSAYVMKAEGREFQRWVRQFDTRQLHKKIRNAATVIMEPVDDETRRQVKVGPYKAKERRQYKTRDGAYSWGKNKKGEGIGIKSFRRTGALRNSYSQRYEMSDRNGIVVWSFLNGKHYRNYIGNFLNARVNHPGGKNRVAGTQFRRKAKNRRLPDSAARYGKVLAHIMQTEKATPSKGDIRGAL